MPYCSIKWCGKSSSTSNYKNAGITFHRFPKERHFKEKWIEVTRRENWFPSAYSVVCSRHFTEDCFIDCNNRRRLLTTAIPTQFLPVLESGETIFTVDGIQPLRNTSTAHLSTTDSEEKPPKLDHERIPHFASPANKRLCRRILELNGKLAKKNGQLKRLRERCRYLQNRLHTLKEVIKDGKHKRRRRNSDVKDMKDILNDEFDSPKKVEADSSSEKDALEIMD